MKWGLALFLLCFFSEHARANSYFGISGNYSFFSNSDLRDQKVSPKGLGYGAMLGIGKDFVGLEAFYQKFNATGKIKHEGETADINTNASALGALLRFSFQAFFLKLGVARYSLDQSVDISNDTNRAAAEDIYNIQDGANKMGVLFGIGVHGKFSIGRLYLDYTRHQISSVGNYDTVEAGIVWNLPDRLFSVGGRN